MSENNSYKETDYNDYADTWIELKAQVNLMHNYSLQKKWDLAEQCAVRAHELSQKLCNFYKELA